MPKPTITESRFDFRKGRNTAVSPDLLNSDELVDATNARLTASYGAFTKRSGSQRIHNAVITDAGAGVTPVPINGIVQWDAPPGSTNRDSNGKQVVAIAGGFLFTILPFTTGFGTLNPGGGNEFSTTEPAFFATFRAATAGAPLILFIASGGKFYTWTGTVLTRIDGATPVLPPDADMVTAYHTRLFVHDTNFKKHIFWSQVGDGTSYVAGSKTDGGSALVDVLSGEELVAIEVIGSSLLLAAEDSIMRFTGHASDDIVIAQDTEGISSEVGVIGRLALKRFENVAAFLSERGPYAATETHVEPIGEQIGPDFATLDTTNVRKSVVGWNKGRKELLYAVPRAGDGGLNKSVFAQAVRLQSWYGPWTYPFGITYMCRFEDVDGRESILAGGNDGFIRDLDLGTLDDVAYDGTGGTAIEMSVELPPFQFGRPGITKSLERMFLQANLPVGSDPRLFITADEEPEVETAITPVGGGIVNYRIDLSEQGKRLVPRFVDGSAQQVTIHGFTLEAKDYNRG